MRANAIASLLCALALALSACGGADDGGSTPAADRGKTLPEVQQAAQASSAGALELTVAAYQAAVDEQVKVVAASVAEVKALAPGDLLSEAGSKVVAEASAAQHELTALKSKLQIYAQELAKKKP